MMSILSWKGRRGSSSSTSMITHKNASNKIAAVHFRSEKIATTYFLRNSQLRDDDDALLANDTFIPDWHDSAACKMKTAKSTTRRQHERECEFFSGTEFTRPNNIVPFAKITFKSICPFFVVHCAWERWYPYSGSCKTRTSFLIQNRFGER